VEKKWNVEIMIEEGKMEDWTGGLCSVGPGIISSWIDSGSSMSANSSAPIQYSFAVRHSSLVPRRSVP
jgi:hypothetical protein